jgi:hypothetical protein
MHTEFLSENSKAEVDLQTQIGGNQNIDVCSDRIGACEVD